jgi:prepilin-type N-terminal cleavage/methylation domain-containing protein
MEDFKGRRHAERGMSLIELLLVMGIMGVVTAMAVLQSGPARNNARGDAAMRIVLSQMNQAREQAIAQRRYIRVTFDVSLNQLIMVREDTSGATPATTTLATIGFEGGAALAAIPSVASLPAVPAETPDAFGWTMSPSFKSISGTFQSLSSSNAAGDQLAKFAPDGTFVDWNGRVTNGTVFIGVTNVPTASRAVTILGSTGRVRAFRWNGNIWKVV